MATRRHTLLAANRRNMGLYEEAESQTAAFNDPGVQRMKMLTQMGDTTKELLGGWKSLQEGAWKHRKKRGDLDSPPRPDIDYEIETEEEDLAEDLTLEEVGPLPDFKPWEAPPGQIEYNRRMSGPDPYKPVHVATQGGKTNFGENIGPESISRYVNFVMEDKTKEPETDNFSDRKEHSSPGWFGEGSWFSDSIGHLREGGLSHKAREAGYPNVNAYLKAVREGEIK